MFHSASSYPEMSPVAGSTASFHQTPSSSANTPVYVPSNRAISHAQYGHAGNYTNTQNGWPAESAFGKIFFESIKIKLNDIIVFITLKNRFNTFPILCTKHDVHASL